MPTPSGCRVAAAATIASPATATSAYHDAPDGSSGYGTLPRPCRAPHTPHACYELDIVGRDPARLGDEAAEHCVGGRLRAGRPREHEHARARAPRAR